MNGNAPAHTATERPARTATEAVGFWELCAEFREFAALTGAVSRSCCWNWWAVLGSNQRPMD